MAIPTLIFCGGNAGKHWQAAVESGYRYGARLPSVTYAPVYFADQNYHKPERASYMKALQQHRPVCATVLDWEHEAQLSEVLDWAEEAAQWAQESVIIIPKVMDIDRLPPLINGKRVVIGYSIPTAYGGTSLPLWELRGRAVHLLGGSPHRQMREYQQMRAYCDVVSADGNMHMKMANTRCLYWTQVKSRTGHWQTFKRTEVTDAPYHCFRVSCENIIAAWEAIT